MGSWGAGNFDNDDATDYLADLIEELAIQIDECLEDPERRALDEQGEAVIPTTAQILSVLVENFNTVPPKPKSVVRWRKGYLAVFDDEIDGLAPTGNYKEERRAVIEQTFQRLEEQSRAYWKRPKAVASGAE
jgi:hypothetical protein